jgi:hypothetical protein
MGLIKLEAIRDICSHVITLTSHVSITDALSKQDLACTLVSCNTMHVNCS